MYRCVCTVRVLDARKSPGTDKSRSENEAVDLTHSLTLSPLDPEARFYEFVTTGSVSGAERTAHSHSSGPVKINERQQKLSRSAFCVHDKE